ncbi:Translation factor guf1 mitochondrial [Cryptotrichosporon argae]
MTQFPPERIRNLSIIAHIDHGKSTLADRLLQMTNTLPPSSDPQFLDKLKVERERGITVKAQTVSIIHTHTDGAQYLVNLIDTPGHVDFSYEVSRSLGACEGGLLLVDCTQGIQAQTLSVFHHAQDAALRLLAVINKVDLPHASPRETSEQIAASLGLAPNGHMMISAKSGLGVDKVLEAIVDKLPAPTVQGDGRLTALVFDTFYDRYRGVVSLVRLFSGSLKKGDKVRFLQADRKYEVLDVGIYNPEEVSVGVLRAGQVGYLVCNMKNSDEAHIGDTVCHVDKPVAPLPGFKPMKAMVFAGVFPMDSAEFPQLEESIERLTLNDRSVSVERESSAALGQGFRLGFLGTLHMDVFRQRLEDEYASNVIVTAPTVPYKVFYNDKRQVFISNPAEFPDVTDTKTRVAHVEEPMVNATIFVPSDYIGAMMDLCARYRGVQQEYRFLENTDRAILRYSLPLSEIVTDFFSELKSASSGFASFDYEEAGYQKSDLVRLNMLLNGKPVDALAMIVHRSAAATVGRAWAKKLREVLPRQLFELAIQAAVGSKVVARESLSAMRKDVTAGLYGGHYERKMKHLNKQKEGKKRLKRLAGNIDIPQSAFFDVLSSRPRGLHTAARAGRPQSLAVFLRQLSTHSHSDAFLPFLPACPAPSPPSAPNPTRTHPPLPPPHMTPHHRSRILSRAHALSTTPRSAVSAPAASAELYKLFTDLYLSSPTQQFTPPELAGLARAVHRLDRASPAGAAAKRERLETLLGALVDAAGPPATRPFRLARLAARRTRRHVSAADVTRAHELLARLFPRAPHVADTAGRQQFAAALNHVLYLCALAGRPAPFERAWARLVEHGLAVDSHAHLARLMLAARTDRASPETVTAALAAAVARVNADAGAIVLVNYALLALAERGAWDGVVGIYTALCPAQTSLVADAATDTGAASQRASAFAYLDHLTPSRQTYALVLRVAVTRGDLAAALGVMGDMLGARPVHVPGVKEYASLFRGFARHVAVGTGPAGPVLDALPPLTTPRTAGALVGGVWAGARPYDSVDAFTGNYATAGRAHAAAWTSGALDDVFDSLLALVPTSTGAGAGLGTHAHVHADATAGGAEAPSRKALWDIVVAFARAGNGEPALLRDVWGRLERKFGPGNAEGWVGWAVDRRLARVVSAMR